MEAYLKNLDWLESNIKQVALGSWGVFDFFNFHGIQNEEKQEKICGMFLKIDKKYKNQNFTDEEYLQYNRDLREIKKIITNSSK